MVITNYKIFTQFNLRNCYDQDTKKKNHKITAGKLQKNALRQPEIIYVATPNIFYKLITNNEKYVDKVNFFRNSYRCTIIKFVGKWSSRNSNSIDLRETITC